MPEIHTPPNDGPITEMYVFLSEDEHGDGIFGIQSSDGTWTPMVTSRAALAEEVKALAEAMAKLSGKTVKLIRFTKGEEIWRATTTL